MIDTPTQPSKIRGKSLGRSEKQPRQRRTGYPLSKKVLKEERNDCQSRLDLLTCHPQFFQLINSAVLIQFVVV